MNWGLIIFIVVALAFTLLIVLAIRKVSRKKKAAPDELSEKQAREIGAEEKEPTEAEETEYSATVFPAPTEKEPSLGKVIPLPRSTPTEKAIAPAQERDHVAETKKLTKGLAKTRGGFVSRLTNLFRSKAELDNSLLEQIEEILFTADIGVSTSQSLIDNLRNDLSRKELKDVASVWEHIKQKSATILSRSDAKPLDFNRHKPFVILVVGVNGTGKTTTIGKLASRFKAQGYSVMLAAGDTFRAAAVEQLEVWGKRADCPVIKGKEGVDPSSVIIEALKQAKESGVDILIADTAGRLHTKINLMEELQKVRRSISKWVEGAPHETFLVLDSTTGQNAIAQAKMFNEAIEISGIILTKLDGTAKGGVILGICNELQIPVRYIGIGEKVDDLREFDPQAFVEALYEGADGGNDNATPQNMIQ